MLIFCCHDTIWIASTPTMYQPNHEAVACCETQNTRELFLQGSSTTDNAVTSLITKCSRTGSVKAQLQT